MQEELSALKTEKSALYGRFDKVVEATQKDRVEGTLHRLEVDKFAKEID